MSGYRCQCPERCGSEDLDPCFDDVTQEDFLCDFCRTNCRLAAPVGTQEADQR